MSAAAGKKLRLTAMLVMLAPFLTGPAIAQIRFQTFFLSVRNSQYIQPRIPGVHGFGELSGANSSARVVADILSRNGAVAGITLTSGGGRYVGKPDFDSALAAVARRMQAARAANPLLVVYFVGHGISEGIAWNHFSVPGNFVYGAPLTRLDVEELASHTIHAASVADDLDKLRVPYVLLLDTCYEGQPASFTSPVLSAEAIRNLQSVAGILRYIDEFHTPNPVIFSAEPGSEVPLAPDPRAPDQSSLGPIGRRLLLLSSRVAASGTNLRLSSMVAQLTSASLDPATSPPVTHATAPTVDGLLLGASTTRALVESRTGTATTQDVCCGRGGGAGAGSGDRLSDTSSTHQTQRLPGSLSFQGPPAEYISGGTTVSLPTGTPVNVEEPSPRILELKFATQDDWELDLAAPEGGQLAPGTYGGAKRYPFQEGNEPGLSLSGAGRDCNEVNGEFVVTKLQRGGDGRVREFVASFAQRCDNGRQPLSGMVRVGGSNP
jgi:hypothetical protein